MLYVIPRTAANVVENESQLSSADRWVASSSSWNAVFRSRARCGSAVTRGTIRGSERRDLKVAAPLVTERSADLAEGSLGAGRLQHGRDHVPPGPGRVEHRGERRVDRRLIPSPPPLGQLVHLLALDLVADPHNLHRLPDGVGQAVDADHPFVALLQLLLVGKGGLGDLRHEPAV